MLSHFFSPKRIPLKSIKNCHDRHMLNNVSSNQLFSSNAKSNISSRSTTSIIINIILIFCKYFWWEVSCKYFYKRNIDLQKSYFFNLFLRVNQFFFIFNYLKSCLLVFLCKTCLSYFIASSLVCQSKIA